MFKFKVGDEVLVISGGNKSRKGKIQKVLVAENKIIVSGVNIYKRHKKATRTQGAGIFEVTRPINVSNIALVCPKCNKPTKVGFSFDGKNKIRVCKKCKAQIPNVRRKNE